MDSQRRPRLLYISPVMPARTGSGLAMRAGMVLEALTSHFDVWLLVVPIYPALTSAADAQLTGLARDTAVLAPDQVIGNGRQPGRFRLGRPSPPAFAGVGFDVIHVFRLAAARFAEPFIAASPAARRQLDIDELDSHALQKVVLLRRATAQCGEAERDLVAQRCAELEERGLDRWQRLYAASRIEIERLPASVRGRARLLPNAVRAPAVVARKSATVARLLFVGTLAYYPNEDAVRYFCTEVLPLLEQRAPAPVEVLIVGNRPGPALSDLDTLPGVRFLGAVTDLADCYAQADAVIAPLRAGGGTRVKILEAFSYQRPVVSTRIGAEGIDARHGEELLLADGPSEFADACLELVRDQAYATRLVSRARSLWLRRHTLQAMIDALVPVAAVGR